MNEWQKDKKNQRQTSLALHWKAILLLYNNGYVMLWCGTTRLQILKFRFQQQKIA